MKVFFILLLRLGCSAFVVVIYLFVCSHPTQEEAEDGRE